MADAADSKSVGRKAVWVRLPPPAPILTRLARRPPARSPNPCRYSPPPPLLFTTIHLHKSGKAPGPRADLTFVTAITKTSAMRHIARPQIRILINY